MKINYLWDKDYLTTAIEIRLNPVNKHLSSNFDTCIHREEELTVINPSNDRQLKIKLSDIYIIKAMDHLSKVYTNDGQLFFTKGHLKHLEYLTTKGIARINNACMLNLNQVSNFKVGQYARLEVQTKNGKTLNVSRHYAQKIKEALS